jgi:hypothetical protein
VCDENNASYISDMCVAKIDGCRRLKRGVFVVFIATFLKNQNLCRVCVYFSCEMNIINYSTTGGGIVVCICIHISLQRQWIPILIPIEGGKMLLTREEAPVRERFFDQKFRCPIHDLTVIRRSNAFNMPTILIRTMYKHVEKEHPR